MEEIIKNIENDRFDLIFFKRDFNIIMNHDFGNKTNFQNFLNDLINKHSNHKNKIMKICILFAFHIDLYKLNDIYIGHNIIEKCHQMPSIRSK